ncbi:TetR/AcrR family transcriptional regulator [Jatrophihabitans telluris]|uniref:TetR/AcrR family transcriptional regulator n=1 Tax=Jatrophihabitans telluris TaxID=2038343 RepID=A0ABY4QUB9_9ACTN|nr:TetR/AcrR family transcriptional regulator [Jatrophihabitans telluris]UQX87023.1 TetR/AcrR family transcriptional regulator [Jatrophihabitans telluris]
MARWEPGAQERLQQAAFALFVERGYDKVTVAEIADRAGLTKRSFFNYFADKREILFADAHLFEAGIVKHLTDADPSLEPIDAAVAALTHGGRQLSVYGEGGRTRRDLIDSSTELQERNLAKLTSLTAEITAALCMRNVPARDASFIARVAVAAFITAYDDWLNDLTVDFATLMQNSMADLRRAIGANP